MNLDLLLSELRAGADLGERSLPTTSPRRGQSARQWLAEVAAVRAVHDSSAVRHRKRVDAACERLFATTVYALLPAVPDTLTHREVHIPLPPQSLADLVPALPAVLAGAPSSVPGVPARTHVAVRVIAPAKPSAVVIRLHGGAFWMGGGGVGEVVDRALIDHVAVTANAAVLNVDYGLAPEYPFPAAAVDTIAVLDAVRAGLVDVPIGPIALLGTSSGANTAVLVARLEAARGHALAALGLVVPSVQLSAGPQSAAMNPAAWAVRSELLHVFLGGLRTDDPWMSPGELDRLDAMPPTFAAVAQFDEVAAGGEALCAAIRAGGQEARSTTYPMTHVVATPDVEAAFITDIAAFLRAHLPG